MNMIRLIDPGLLVISVRSLGHADFFVQGSQEPVLLNLYQISVRPSGRLNLKFTTIEGFWVN